MTDDALTLADIEASIAATLTPLREQLRIVEGRERLILNDLEETRAMKNRLLSTLRKLDPSMAKPGPKKKGTAGGYGTEERHREAVAAAKKAIDSVVMDAPDGFTRTRVHTQMKQDGFPIGDSRLIRVMDELHTSGYLTLHKLVTGGNKAYRRTEDVSNGSPRQAV